MSKKKITIGVALLAILALFLFWPSETVQHDSTRADATMEYPAAWNQMGLPTISGSSLTEINGSNLDEGIEFEFEVNQSAGDVGNYFEEEFEDRDFDTSGPDESDDENYASDFTSGDVGISVDVRPDPSNRGRSKVRIWIQQEEKAVVSTQNASFSID